MMDTVEFYTDAGGRVRWRRHNPAEGIVGRCGSGFNSEEDAHAHMLRNNPGLTNARVVRVGETPPPAGSPPPPPVDRPPSLPSPYGLDGHQAASQAPGDTDVPPDAPDAPTGHTDP